MARGPQTATWSDDEDRRLMDLWRERHTFLEMAWDFPGRTRNACIGRLTRLRKKWGTEIVPPGREGRPGLPVVERRKRVRQKTNNFNVKRKPTNYAINRAIAEAGLPVREPAPIKQPPTPPTARRLSLLELGPKDCRFIVTDHQTREHLYCALDASPFADDCGNNCYCSFHQRVMRASGFR